MAHANTPIASVLTAALLLGGSGAALSDESANETILDPQADALLRKMSDYMGGLTSFSTNAFVFDEQIMGDGFKLSVLRSGSLKVQRPNKFYVSRKGALRDQEAFFDGKRLVLHGKHLGVSVEIPMSGDVDSGLEAANEVSGSELPARDLISADAYTPLMEAVTESAYLGAVDIAGVSCRQLAFRTAEVDFQLWIEEGERSLPCRYTITSKWLAGAPQYTVTFTHWQVNQELPASDFEFSAPDGNQSMTVQEFRDALLQLGGE